MGHRPKYKVQNHKIFKGENLDDLRCCNDFLDKNTKSTICERNNKSDFIKIKKFYSAKDIDRVRRQATNSEKLFTKKTSDIQRTLISQQ